MIREVQEEYPSDRSSRDITASRMNEDYVTQISKEIERRVTKKVFQDFNRTNNRTLGAFSKLHEFFSNSRVSVQSKMVSGFSRDMNSMNQEPN